MTRQRHSSIASSNSSTSSFGDDSNRRGTPNNGAAKRRGSNVSSSDLGATLARPETKAVGVLRVIVLTVIAAAALAVSLSVYFYMKRDEESSLDSDFNELSHRLFSGVHANTQLRVQTMDMLGLSLTSSAISTNQTFPFVTFADFEARATAARAICKSDSIGLYPYVTNENRKNWEKYTTQMENLAWMNESFAYQVEFKEEHGRTVGSRAPARALRAAMVNGSTGNTTDGFKKKKRV